MTDKKEYHQQAVDAFQRTLICLIDQTYPPHVDWVRSSCHPSLPTQPQCDSLLHVDRAERLLRGLEPEDEEEENESSILDVDLHEPSVNMEDDSDLIEQEIMDHIND